jgi:glucose/arabinose dehydrogenase
VAFGDKVQFGVATDTSNNLGSLLRIEPNREPDSGGWEPHPEDPFIDGEESSSAIHATGLRSPWRGLLDQKGRFWFGDVGGDRYEEINVVTQPGQDMGWPLLEGECNCARKTDPVTGWDRDLDHPYLLDDEDAVPLLARVAYVGIEYRDRGKRPLRLST